MSVCPYRPNTVPEITRAQSKPTSGDGRVLLYYCYIDIANPEALRSWQVNLCKALGLRGRIHVSTEGINGSLHFFFFSLPVTIEHECGSTNMFVLLIHIQGTVGGSRACAAVYMLAMRRHAVWSKLFQTIDFKLSSGSRSCFPNLFVKGTTHGNPGIRSLISIPFCQRYKSPFLAYIV